MVHIKKILKRAKSCHLWQHGWTLKGIILSEISQTEKDKYYLISLYVESKKNQTHGYREQIGGCQRQELGEMGEDGQKVQTFSYKITNFWGCNIQHGDYS